MITDPWKLLALALFIVGIVAVLTIALWYLLQKPVREEL